jgi:flagellar hook-basal body complex protein FliE
MATNNTAAPGADNASQGTSVPQDRQNALSLSPFFHSQNLPNLGNWLSSQDVTLATNTVEFTNAYPDKSNATLTVHELLFHFNNVLGQAAIIHQEKETATAQATHLTNDKEQVDQVVLNLQEQNQNLQVAVHESQLRELHLSRQLLNSTSTTTTTHARRQHPGHDPASFTAGESNLVKRQQQYQTWQDKIISALELDKGFFNTELLRIHYACNLLSGYAYEGIRDGLRTVKEDTPPVEWKWPNVTSLLAMLQAQYVTTDLARQAKMELDVLVQKKDVPFPNFIATFKQLAERCSATDAEKKDLIKRKVDRPMLAAVLNQGLGKDSVFEDWATAFMDYHLQQKELDHYTKHTTTHLFTPSAQPAPKAPQVTHTTMVVSNPDSMDLSSAQIKPSFTLTPGNTNTSYDYLKGQPRPVDPQDPMTRPWCMANRACYYCKDVGHQLQQYPKKGKTSRNFATPAPQTFQTYPYTPPMAAPYPEQRQIEYNRDVALGNGEGSSFTVSQSSIAPSQSLSQANTPTTYNVPKN